MKKGFTMIELIFVIVILGILASVAIPRLAGTRADAEISATIGNLRTLLSDAASYYTVKGEFGTNTKFSEITGVKVDTDAVVTTGANLEIGRATCIKVTFKEKNGNTPAYMQLDKVSGANGVCKQVQEADSLKPFLDNVVTTTGDGEQKTNIYGVPVGATAEVYQLKNN